MSSSGIPQIKPRQRTAWQDSRPAPGRPTEKDEDGGNGSHDRPPPEPGTGEVVDTVV